MQYHELATGADSGTLENVGLAQRLAKKLQQCVDVVHCGIWTCLASVCIVLKQQQ